MSKLQNLVLLLSSSEKVLTSVGVARTLWHKSQETRLNEETRVFLVGVPLANGSKGAR